MKATTTALLGLLATITTASPQGRPGYGPPSGPGMGSGRPGFPGRPGGGPPQPPPTPIPDDDDKDFEPLHHLGANSPWFPGPNVFGIDPAAPNGCVVDQAVYIARHGSRYPDPGAYNGWLELYQKLQNATFTATGPLSFLPHWKPVLDYPDEQLRQLSPGGWDELHTMGLDLLTRYPQFHTSPSTPYRLFSNHYPRTIDSARLFARGHLGPNATTLGTVLAINASDPSAVANSLATSDSCPTYNDVSGAGYVERWDAIYLPPIVERLQQYVQGDLVLEAGDVSSFPYLCGFESQILRERSPFCGMLTREEVLRYEYRQDLRYWYGTGPGASRNSSVMLPVVQGVVDLLKGGPDAVVKGAKEGETETVGPLSVAFTHDNQINQMVSCLGVFDGQEALDPERMDPGRVYVSSRNNPMRGTVAFERLTCGAGGEKMLRVKLNDAVYPIHGCESGPGRSCPLKQYNEQVLARKWEEAGTFEEFCELEPGSVTTNPETGGVTFFTDVSMPAMESFAP